MIKSKIYVEVEDKKDGLRLCSKIKETYFNNHNEIVVESLEGIFHLAEKLDSIFSRIDDNDMIIIVYDHLFNSALVAKNLVSGSKYLAEHGLKDRVIWVPTNSFEIEMLSIHGIELLCNREEYIAYFYRIRQLLDAGYNIEKLTTESKKANTYKNMYERVRKQKRNIIEYKRLSEEDFERSITLETISKIIMSRVFYHLDDIRPVRECWLNNCCYKSTGCRYRNIDLANIIEKQNYKISNYKIQALINETNYIGLVKELAKLTDEKYERNVKLMDLIDEQIPYSNYVNKIIKGGKTYVKNNYKK